MVITILMNQSIIRTRYVAATPHRTCVSTIADAAAKIFIDFFMTFLQIQPLIVSQQLKVLGEEETKG